MTVFRDFPRTLLPIDTWAQIVGIDPRHFRQITTSKKPVRTCATVWKQYSWQESDQVGRYDVAEAIQHAEKTIAQHLGYKLLPAWEVNERIRTPKAGNRELFRLLNYDPSGYYLGVPAKWGYFVEGGVQAKPLIEAGVAIVWKDEDLDGYFEAAEISFTATDANGVAVTDEEEIAVFYPGESGADKWEIRPLQSVSIVGGTATVRMWRHQLALPNLIEALDPQAIDGDVNTTFLDEVDVYRRWNDPQTQVTLIWDGNLFNCNLCSSGTACCPVCGQTTQAGCLMPKDYEAGFLMYRPADWDSDDEEFDSATLTCGRNPDQLLMNYRAGWRDKSLDWPHLEMDHQWARAVAYYALTLLDRDVCDCAPIKGISEKWRQDLAIGGPVSFQINTSVLNNPLGTTRGAVFAWNMIKEQGRRLASPVRW